MQLVATLAQLIARAAQRLQACIHAVKLALRELDRIGSSFESGTYWRGPLFGIQKANVFTARKMRLLQ